MRLRSLFVALALATVAAPALAEPTAADRESARAAFTEANQLRDAGKVREALEKYKAAFALAPTPVTALEVGRAQADLGQLVEARETLLGVDHIGEAGQESAKAKAARKEAAELAGKIGPRISKLTIRLVGQAEDVSVNVDGSAVPRAALAVARSVNPGRHAVMAIVAGHTVQQTIDVREGETRDVVLDITRIAAQTTSPPPSPEPQQMSGSGVVAFNTSDDGHAWSLQDPHGQQVCKLPCAQALGFTNGYSVVRDDGERVSVPGGLAALPGTAAQVEPHGTGGSRIAGWTLVGVGAAALVGGLVVMSVGLAAAAAPASAGGDHGTGAVATGLVIAGVGTVVLVVGTYVLAFSHGPMLVRTDMGVPMRVSKSGTGLRVHLAPTGIFGTF